MNHISEQGVKALVNVAEWLEAGAKHVVIDPETSLEIGFFDMEYAVVANMDNDHTNACGTACCIAGAVCQFERLGLDERDSEGDLDWITPADVFSNEEKPAASEPQGAFFLAADHLGISYADAQALFAPFSVEGLDASEYNAPKIAARVVRKFIETGEVSWIDARDEVYLSSK